MRASRQPQLPSFSVMHFLSISERGTDKTPGVLDFAVQGVHSYVVRQNLAQKKRITIFYGEIRLDFISFFGF